MIFHWRGLGFLAVVLPFVSLVLMELLVEATGDPGAYQQRATFWGGLALVPSGTLVWLLGRRLNYPKQATIGSEQHMAESDIALASGPLAPKVESSRRHSLFFLPMEWWGLITVAFGVVLLIGSPFWSR